MVYYMATMTNVTQAEKRRPPIRVNDRTKRRLNKLKNRWNANSVDEVIRRLLDAVEPTLSRNGRAIGGGR